MNLSKLASIAAFTLLVGVAQAQAQAIRIPVPNEVPLPVSTLTRAEVLADYHVWRLSGLQALTQGEQGPDVGSRTYRLAQARYEWLRASPQFAQLVAALAERPNASVVAGSTPIDELAASGGIAVR